MSYIRSLRNILKDKNLELYGKLLNIEEKAKSLLTYTAGKFPYYTPHDFVTHSRNVEENLNWIIDDDIKEKFNPYEIFFLLVAAWLHDWGMIGEKDEDPKKIRTIHNLRTEKYLEKLHDKVYLSLHEARIVGKICRGHTKEDLMEDYYADTIFGASLPIRVRFLTSCLRIADECDVTANRTPEIIYYSLNPTDKAEEEFKKHLSISGIGRPERERHKIQLFGVAWDPRGIKVLEQVRDEMQRELDAVKVFLAQQGLVIDYVELRVDTRGFINKPIELVLDRKKIVELLIGSSLYSRKDCAIRELLQNAVDTCRLKKVLEEDYNPSIKFYFSKEKIRVEDNGFGMDYEDTIKFLSRKGASFYVSEELNDMLGGKEFVPISKFGIGVLSCFLIASKIIIETRKRGCSACRFIIENLAERWRYEESSKATEGTQITLFLNEEGKKIDAEYSLQHYAKRMEIPITLVNEDSGESKNLRQRWDPSMPEVEETIVHRSLGRLSSLSSNVQDDIILNQTIRSDGIEATYFLLRKDSPYLVGDRKCFLSYQGIYVGNFDFFPLTRGTWFVLVNCTKELIDISVSRENLIQNDKNMDFIRMLFDNFVKFVDTVATEGRDKGPHDFDYCVQYSSFLHRFLYDFMTVSRGDIRSELISKIELEKIHPVLGSQGLRFVEGKNIFSDRSIKKIYQYLLPSNECEHHAMSVIPFLKASIKEGEVVVFDIGPHFSIHDETENRVKSALLILCEKKGIAFESSNLFKVLRNLPLKKVSTPLDQLLPRNSSFVEMPKQFRSLIVYRKPYRFISRNTAETSDIDATTYRDLLKKELFHDEPIIASTCDNRLRRETETEFKKISDGEFLFDSNDSFLKLIAENADKVVSNDLLKRLVWIYLRSLAYLMSENQLLFETEFDYLFVIGKMIAMELGQEQKYQPLFERIGKMNDVLRGYGNVPSTTIYGWMNIP